MRIIILNNFAYVTGGADRHCFDLAHILREAGHDVAFLSTAAPQNVEAVGAFIPLRVTNATRDEMPYVDRAGVASRALWNRTAKGAMDRLLSEFRPDVVHAHKIYPHLSLAPILSAGAREVPIVQTVHDYEFVSASALDDAGGRVDRHEARLEYRMLNTVLFQMKLRLHVPAVSAWVAVSDAAKDTYKRYGIECSAICNFTLNDTGAVPGFARRRGILYAGRLTVAKGTDDLIAVARAMPEVTIRVAGQGPLEGKLRVAASKLPNLEFLGKLSPDDVQGELRRSRVCVMPSRWQEPGPLACLEAMAAGTPVVAYRVGGLAEYVQKAGSGRVVSEDATELANACRALVTDPREWQDLSANAVRAARGAHSPETYRETILGIYHHAMRSVA